MPAMCSASRLFSASNKPLAGNSCFTISMIADLGEAARVFGNRGYRYVYFEAGAIGQRLYVGAEALGWNATGIGAFYDDDVHRYLGFLEEGTDSVGASVREAEKAALVMLGSPASRAAAQDRDSGEFAPVISESGEEHPANPEKLGENKNDDAASQGSAQTPSPSDLSLRSRPRRSRSAARGLNPHDRHPRMRRQPPTPQTPRKQGRISTRCHHGDTCSENMAAGTPTGKISTTSGTASPSALKSKR